MVARYLKLGSATERSVALNFAEVIGIQEALRWVKEPGISYGNLVLVSC